MHLTKTVGLIILSASIHYGCGSNKLSPDYALAPNDLIKLNECNLDEFDTRMANNNYHLFDKKYGDAMFYCYEHKENEISGKPFYQVFKVITNSGQNKVVFFMKNNNEYYADLKEKIKDLGFTFSSEETYYGQPTFKYIKEGNDQLIKISPQRTNKELFVMRIIYFRKEPYTLN